MSESGTSRPETFPSRSPARRIVSALLPLALLGGALLYYYSFHDHGIIPNDEGHLVHLAERMHAGEVPGLDFHLDTYIFGRYVLLSALFDAAGGPDLLVERYLWVGLRALCVLLLFLIGRRLMPALYAAGASAFVLVLPGPWHKTPYAFTALLGLWTLFVFLRRRRIPALILMGAATAAGLLLRQDVGLIVLAVSSGALFLAATGFKRPTESGNASGSCAISPGSAAGPDSSGSWFKRYVAWQGLYLGATLLFLAPAVIYLIMHDALGPTFHQCFVEKIEQHLGLFNFIPRLEKMWAGGDTLGVVYFLIPPLIFLGAALLLLIRALRRAPCPCFVECLALFGVALLTINQAYNHALIIRLLQCAPPLVLLAGLVTWFFADLCLPALTGSPKKARPYVEVAVPLTFTLLLGLCALEIMTSNRESNLGVEYRGSVATYDAKNRPLQAERAPVLVAPEKADLLNRATAWIDERLPPEGTLFVASNDSILYFLSKRRNPTRYAKFFMPGEAPSRPGKVLAELQRTRPDLIVATARILRERKDHPGIRFIQENYRREALIDTGYQKRYVMFVPMDREAR